MKIIGLTGNSGSGKSKVSAILSKYGAYIIDSDQISHELLIFNQEAINEVIGYFGFGILNETGIIDRKKLGLIVFNDPLKLEKLMDITHKYIIEEILAIIDTIKRSPGEYKYIVIDAPLLIKANLHPICHQVLVVYANYDTRMQRIMKRDGISPELAAKRLDNQMPYGELLKYAHYVIENNGTIEALEEKVAAYFNLI